MSEPTSGLSEAESSQSSPDIAPRGIAARESTGIYPYSAVWCRPVGGPLVLPMRSAGLRIQVGREQVTVIGTVEYEPGMVRVRRQNESVTRALVADIRVLGAEMAREHIPGHGFVCKKCGGPSPVGVGFLADGADAAAASAGLTHCACGWSQIAS